MHFPQLLRRGRIMVHLRRLRHQRRFARDALVFAVEDDRVVNIVGQPDLHDGDPDVPVVPETEFREVQEALVGQVGRRQNEHVDLTGAQGLLGRVGGVRENPVGQGLGACDKIGADDFLVGKTARLGHFRQDGGDGCEKAVVARVNALPAGDGAGGGSGFLGWNRWQDG